TGGNGGLRPGRSLIDPGPQQADLFIGERVTFFRHSRQIFLGAGDGLYQQALGALSGDKSGTRISAFEGGRSLVEPQAALLLFRPVTFPAGVREDGLDVLDEIDSSSGR